jgi:TonB-dependent receptor
MGGASMLVLGMAAAAPVFAADAPATAAADDTVVVVTGQRAQLKSAQKIKKDAPDIVDSVTAVDIGALPDRSVAEALQRISGITIQRSAEARDPIRMTAEAGDVEIRGLSWVRSETNGRDIFSAKNGRGLSWGDVSSDLLAGVDVHKNASADLIEGGVGGTVNLRTRLPFDSKKRVFAFTLDDTYGDLEKKHQDSGSFLYSDRWDTNIGEVGLLLNYSLVNEGNMTNVIGVDRYNAGKVNTVGGVTTFNSDLTTPGTTVYIPNTMGWRTIDWRQKRTATNIAVQWRPSEDMEWTLTIFDAKAHPKNTEYNTGFYNDNGEFTSSASLATYKYSPSGLFQSGTVKSASITSNTRWGEDVNETTDISLHGRWNVTSKFTLAGDVQYVRSTAKDISNTVFIQPEHRPDANIDITGDLPLLTISTPNTTSTKGDYWYAAAMDHLENNQGHESAVRLDGQYDFDGGWLKNFKFGIRTTDKEYVTRQTGYNWGLLSNQYWQDQTNAGNGSPYYIDGTVHRPACCTATANTNNSGQPLNANIPNLSTLVSFANFMNGDVPVPGNIWFPSEALVSQGTAYTFAQLHATETNGWGWAPLDTDLYKLNNNGLNVQTEKTKAIYGLFNFGGDASWAGNGSTLDGNFGVRVVETESTGSSYIITNPLNPPAGTCAVNCTTYNKYATFGVGNFPYSGSNKYTYTLPSLNLRLKYSDTWQFRFAASRGMVRPQLSWLTPYSTLSASFTYQTGAQCTPTCAAGTFGIATSPAPTFTGTGGSPDLKPILSDNYDLTSEWYFAPTGSLTFDLFAKNISNYIGSQTVSESYTNNGQTVSYNVVRYVNGTEEGKVSGFEIAYQQFYDFLPGFWSGFGLQANYTHIDSSGGRNAVNDITDTNQITGSNLNGLPLEGMSPDSYNIAGMYEKYGISARIAYNWRSKYLYTTSAANVNRPMWSDDYGQIDGSVFYTINPNYKIGLQVTNLGHATTKQLVSSDLTKPLETQPYSWIKTDRRISVILRGSF